MRRPHTLLLRSREREEAKLGEGQKERKTVYHIAQIIVVLLADSSFAAFHVANYEARSTRFCCRFVCHI